jgi:D-galacturonate reductase
MESQNKALPNSIIFGTGEYSTGYVAGTKSKSDKKIGVVSLVHFDLKYRKKIGDRIVLVGVNGKKFPGIREHLKKNIENVYTGLDTAHESFPDD